MKKALVLALSVGLFAVAAHAQDPEKAQVEAMAKAVTAQDTAVSVSKSSDGVCGSAGPSYLVELKIRHYTRVGQFDFEERWDTAKTYGIPASEVGHPGAQLMDSEHCAE